MYSTIRAGAAYAASDGDTDGTACVDAMYSTSGVGLRGVRSEGGALYSTTSAGAACAAGDEAVLGFTTIHVFHEQA